MIPKIIHFTISNEISPYIRSIIESAKDQHNEWTIKIWRYGDKVQNSRLEHYHDKVQSGAQWADLMRCDVIYNHGGFYIDADLRLCKGLDQFIQSDNLLVCSEDGTNLTNAFFGAPEKNKALDAIIEQLLAIEPDWSRPPNETTGPRLFASVLRYRQDITVLPRETFYPYNWNEAYPSKIPDACIGIHEWAGSWKEKNSVVAEKKISVNFKQVLKRRLKLIQPIIRRMVKAAAPVEYTQTKLSSKSYGAQNDLVVITNRGLLMSLPGTDLSLSPSIALKGTFEPSEENFVASIVRGGDWVIDVGANVGLFSIIAAHNCGPFGRVFAIEPNDVPRNYLKKSILLNWFHDRVQLLDFAASDKEGEVLMEGTDERLGEHRIKNDYSINTAFGLTELYASEVKTKKVMTRKIEEVFHLDVPIKILKIDAEGHEAAILRGARRLFKNRCVEYLMIEVSKEIEVSAFKQLVDELNIIRTYGYSCAKIESNGNLNKAYEYQPSVNYLGHINLVFYTN